MKHLTSTLNIFFLCSCILLISCSNETSFYGTWDNINNRDYTRIELNKDGTLIRKINFSAPSFQRRLDIDKIIEQKENDGKLTIRLYDKVLLFTKNKNGDILIYQYPQKSDFERILIDNPPRPEEISKFSQKDNNKDKFFEHLEPAIKIYGKTWKDYDNPNNDVLFFDGNNGNIKLIDKELIQYANNKTELPLMHYEEFQDGDKVRFSTFEYPYSFKINFKHYQDNNKIGAYSVIHVGDKKSVFNKSFIEEFDKDQIDKLSKHKENAKQWSDWVTNEIKKDNK